MSRKGVRILVVLRNFFFAIVNKEFLIFLFFLFVSGTFWLVMTMTEVYEREYAVPIRLINVPKDVVVTSDVNDTIKVTIRDKGYVLLAYKYSMITQPIAIDYRNHSRSSERGIVASGDLLKLIYKELAKSSRITSMKPDHLVYYYTEGKSKTVPLRLNGKIITGQNYYVSKIEFSPERVEVFARKSLLDSIRTAYTENMVINNLTDTLVQKVALIYPDILTETTVEVPITAVNMPGGKILRTFPSRVKVMFVTGVGNIRNISASQFRVEANYEDIAAHPSEKCSLSLTRMPQGIRNSRLEISEVDYLIETQ